MSDTTSACGLVNLGNTCYINAALQCLAHCPHLRKCIKEHKQHHYVYQMLSDVLKKMWSMNNGAVSPNEFVGECYRSLASVLTPRQQHDISEFVMALFDLSSTVAPAPVTAPVTALSRDNKREKPVDIMIARIHTAYASNAAAASPLGQCALMQTVAQVCCGACGKKEHRFEHATMLFVPPMEHSPISRCVERAFECETKRDWTCDHCKQRVPSKLSRKVTALPRVLIVAINRFDANMDKVKDEVLVEHELDLTAHAILLPRSTPKRYRLAAMACHSGSGMHSGHYYSVAWCGNAWVRYDDESRVVEARDRGANGFKSRDAYLAFYTPLVEEA